MAYDQHWFTTLCLVTSSVIAVVANLMLVIIFIKRRGLRTVSNRFVLNLLITNLLSSLLIIPLLVLEQDNSTDLDQGSSQLNFTILPGNATSEPWLQSGEIVAEEEEVIAQTIEIENRAGASKEQEIQSQNQSKDTQTTKADGLETLKSSNRTSKEPKELQNRIVVMSTTITEELEGLPVSPKPQATFSETPNFLCYFSQSSTSLLCSASIFSILLIGIDQYFAVIHSLRYHSYIDKSKSLVLILTSWAVAFVLSGLGTITQTSRTSLWQFCHHPPSQTDETKATLATIYAFVYFIAVIFLPFIAICIIYVCIYTAAHENSERMRKSISSQCSSGMNFEKQAEITSLDTTPTKPQPPLTNGPGKSLHKVHSAPTFGSFDQLESDFTKESRKEVTYMMPFSEGSDCDSPYSDRVRKVSRALSERVSLFHSLRYKISNAAIFRYREESRAAKISILVIFMVLVCYLPYGVALVLNTGVFGFKPPFCFNYASIVLLVASNVISPFFFAYRNKRIRRELRKFCGLSPTKTPIIHSLNSPKRGVPKGPAQCHNALDDVEEAKDSNSDQSEPFLPNNGAIPRVVVEMSPEKKSILKRVCSKNWPNYKNCNFISVPESCLGVETRGSFSSASTQISSEE